MPGPLCWPVPTGLVQANLADQVCTGSGHCAREAFEGFPGSWAVRARPAHPFLLGVEDRTEEVTHQSHEASEEQSGDVGTGSSTPTSWPSARIPAAPREPVSSACGVGGLLLRTTPLPCQSLTGDPRATLSRQTDPS